jgi:tyrosine-protein kinase Etk/Wzc
VDERSSPPDFPPDPHVMDFVVLLMSRKWGMLCITLACAAFGLGITYILPQTFRAESEMLPPDRISSSGLLSKYNSGFALEMLKEVENPSVDLLQNILESRTLEERLARDSTIHWYYASQGMRGRDIVEAVRSDIKADPGFSKMLVRGTVETGWFPTAADKENARLLTAHVTNLAVNCMDSTLRWAIRSMAHSTRVFADSDYALKRDQLDSLDGRQEAFEQAHGVVKLESQTLASIEQMAQLKADRDQAEIQLHMLSLDLSNDATSKEAAMAKLNAADAAANDYESERQIGPSLDSLPEVSREYAELLRDRKQLEPIVAFLRVEAEQERIFEVREKSLITVLDTAIAPEKRIGPVRSAMGLLGLIVGIAISLVYVALRSVRLSWTSQLKLRHRELADVTDSANAIYARRTDPLQRNTP